MKRRKLESSLISCRLKLFSWVRNSLRRILRGSFYEVNLGRVQKHDAGIQCKSEGSHECSWMAVRPLGNLELLSSFHSCPETEVEPDQFELNGATMLGSI